MELSYAPLPESDLITPSSSGSKSKSRTRFIKEFQTPSNFNPSKKSSKTSRRKKHKVHCPYCSRKVKHKAGLKQHITIKHPDKVKPYQKISSKFVFTSDLTVKSMIHEFPLDSNGSVILADENLNFDSYLVKKLAQVQKKHIYPLPARMRGYCDEMILRFLIIHHFGLVTQDKAFAIRASKKIPNVYLLSQNSLIKMEKVIF